MAHVALARKYRPQVFADLIGQEAIVKTLQQAIAGGRIHHAYIFTGTRGIGKTTAARIFAKALNCQRGPASEPCNSCDSCLEITEGGSVDVFEIDAASHTKVEETRELMGRVAYSPAGGKYRIFIIDEAHMLSKSSFNALLKTLEEPPAHAVFILATTEPQKILDTVRSRCIEFVFRRIAPASIAANLKRVLDAEKIDYDDAALQRLGMEADGSMRDALSLADQVIGFSGDRLSSDSVEAALGLTSKDVVAGLWRGIFERDPVRVHQTLSDAYRNGSDLRRLGIDLADFLRQVIVVRTLNQVGDGLIAEVVGASASWSLSDLYRMFDRLHAALLEIERSPIPDIALETALLRLAVLEPLGKLEDLLTGGSSGGSAIAPNSLAPNARNLPSNPTPKAASAGNVEQALQESVPDAEQVLATLGNRFPSVGSIVKKHGQWDGQTLHVALPAGDTVFRALLAQDANAIVEALRQMGHPKASLNIAEQTSSTLQSAPNRPQGSKRELLDDERLTSLLKSFPGAEVVDIRRVQ